MPDIEYTVLNGASKKLKDMGDGTHAEVVYVANAAGGSSGSGASIEKQIIPGVDSSAPSVTIYQNWDLSVTPPTVSYVNQSGATVTLAGTFVPDADTTGATAAKQDQQTALLTTIDADLGAKANAAATTDTGTFSLIALVKRGLQNWTTLLGRIPAAIIPGLLPVDTLATPVWCHVATAGAATSAVLLQAGTRRLSVDATGGAAFVRYGISTDSAVVPTVGNPVEKTISVPAGGTKDFDVAAGTTHLHVIRDGGTDAALRITELT